MPWHIEKRGPKYAVVKGHKGEKGRTFGTHPSRAAATKQLRALYASERRK